MYNKDTKVHHEVKYQRALAKMKPHCGGFASIYLSN